MALSQLSGYISDEEEAQVFGESEKVKAIDSGNKVNRKAKKNFFSLPQTESSGRYFETSNIAYINFYGSSLSDITLFI